MFFSPRSEAYGEPFGRAGAMWRGDPPNGKLKEVTASERRSLHRGHLDVVSFGPRATFPLEPGRTKRKGRKKAPEAYHYQMAALVDKKNFRGEARERRLLMIAK